MDDLVLRETADRIEIRGYSTMTLPLSFRSQEPAGA